MIVKLCAVWFVVLSALPFTAPFSTMDTADVARHGAGGEVGLLTPPSAEAVTDDTAMAVERADLAVRVRPEAVVQLSCHDTIADVGEFLPWPASTSITSSPPSRTTVLRV